MKPEYLAALKSGIKTSIIVFITSLVAGLVRLMDVLRSWTVDGNPPNMAVLQSLLWSAVLALLLGVGNSLVRFAQAAAVPFVGALFDKIVGVAPVYNPPPEAPVDKIGEDPINPDKGESTLVVVLCVLGIIVLFMWILNNR